MQLFINNWATVLTAPALSGDLSLSVDPGKAAELVGLAGPDHYLLTLSASVDGIETAWEVVKVTAVSGSVLTVERGQEGTVAAAWGVDAEISARATAGSLVDLRGATLAQGALADTAVQPGDLATVATTGAYADLAGLPTIPTTAAEVGAIASTEKGAASGVATLDAGSKIPLAQLPATAITDTSVVASEAAMLALTAQTGDVAIRTDISTSFILRAEPATTLGNWEELLSPAVGGGAAVGSDTPQNLGVASPGVSTSASRQDHVHNMPSATDVGADAAGSAAAAQAAAVQRANHTGTQLAGTISDFAASVRATVLTGLSLAVGTAVAATDTVLEAFGKLQKQITDLTASVAAKITNPMTTAADIIVGGASGVPARLAKGAALQVLRVNAGATALEYADPSSGVSLPVIRAITASETLALSNINSFGVNSTASNYVSTIPAQATVAWTADAELHFLPTSTGTLTLTAAAGVTLNGVTAGSLTLSTQHGAATIKRTGLDAWWCGGSLGTLAEQRTALGIDLAALVNTTATQTISGLKTFTGSRIQLQNTSPGFWLDETDGSGGAYVVLDGGVFQIQRRASAFGAFQAAPVSVNIAAPTSSLAVGSDGATSFGSAAKLASYTLATVPSASANTRGLIWISNLAGQVAPCFSDGTNWRRVSDDTVAS